MATERGHSISQIAALPRQALLDLTADTTVEDHPSAIEQDTVSRHTSPKAFDEACLAAVIGFDQRGLEECLAGTSVFLTKDVVLGQVVVPLLRRSGELWRKGSLKIINEHLASTVVRSFLWKDDASLDSMGSHYRGRHYDRPDRSQ